MLLTRVDYTIRSSDTKLLEIIFDFPLNGNSSIAALQKFIISMYLIDVYQLSPLYRNPIQRDHVQRCIDLKNCCVFVLLIIRSLIIIVKERKKKKKKFNQMDSYEFLRPVISASTRGSNSRLTNQMPKCFPEITKASSRENSIDRCFMIMLSRTVWIDRLSFDSPLFSSSDSRMKNARIKYWS